MGYENLQPPLERFKMTAGFIAGGEYTSVPAANAQTARPARACATLDDRRALNARPEIESTPGLGCAIMRPSGPAVGFIVYLLPLQITTLAQSSARSRECPQQREISPEVFAMAHKLFIGGLAFSTSTDRLREVFAEAGAVESAAVVMDRDTGQSRGFGFVEMASAEAAAEAVKKFNGKDLDGRTLKVEVANSTGAGGSRSGGGGGFGNRGGGGRRW